MNNQPLNPFDYVEPCEENCTPERHAYHQGQWDMATRMSQDTGHNMRAADSSQEEDRNTSPKGSPISDILDKIYDYGYKMGRDGKTDGTHEDFNLAKANQEVFTLLEEAIGPDEVFKRNHSIKHAMDIRNDYRKKLRSKLGITGDTNG